MTYKDVDEYIESAPKEAQAKLTQLRQLIKETAPKAEEAISYQMPGYKLNGPLIYFAAFKNHISIFPTGSKLTDDLNDQTKSYRTGKGTLQFPLDQPLPLELIKALVGQRLKENSHEGR